MMINLRSYEYLMRSSYQRIHSGKLYDENLKPYTLDFLNETMEFFISLEEYEKCDIILNAISIKDHEIGFINNKKMEKMEKKHKLSSSVVNNFLSKNAPEKFAKEIDIFFCNCSLDKKKQEELINLINKLID